MASSSPPPLEEKEDGEDTPYSTPTFRPYCTLSFSSSSPTHSRYSSFSFNDYESPPFSPTTPLKLKGIPFSWEQVPGIPKRQHFHSKDPFSAHDLLPLPPAGNSTKKLHNVDHHTSNRFQRDHHDPFLAALLECSKDDHDARGNVHWKGSSKVSTTLSDRFGFVSMYTSCKRTCAVSESIVYLPKPTPHYLLNRRR